MLLATHYDAHKLWSPGVSRQKQQALFYCIHFADKCCPGYVQVATQANSVVLRCQSPCHCCNVRRIAQTSEYRAWQAATSTKRARCAVLQCRQGSCGVDRRRPAADLEVAAVVAGGRRGPECRSTLAPPTHHHHFAPRPPPPVPRCHSAPCCGALTRADRCAKFCCAGCAAQRKAPDDVFGAETQALQNAIQLRCWCHSVSLNDLNSPYALKWRLIGACKPSSLFSTWKGRFEKLSLLHLNHFDCINTQADFLLVSQSKQNMYNDFVAASYFAI